MDGNDLGMIARVFMFLLKGLKYVLKLVWFTGLWWFCVPLVVGIGYEEITGTFIQNNQIMDGIFTILWYACYVLCPLNFLQNIIRMVKKDRKFSFLELLLHNRQKKGFEAKLGGDTVALKTAKDLSGVVFGKSNGKYATMPESTDGHILIVGGAVLDIYDALLESTKIKHILGRHEQGVAHAADGYARATGKVGVCLVTSGPGPDIMVMKISFYNQPFLGLGQNL